MALSRRTGQRFQASIWPGFVDAMTALLLVLMFVLTIFMVVQFVLRETITGQESELDDLSSQIIGLADALGLSQQRAAGLEDDVVRLDSSLATARSEAETRLALIASLTAQSNAQSTELQQQRAAITGFEAQVASLLAERDAARGEGAALTQQLADADAARSQLISDQEALQLALAKARDEIDVQLESARLAAARKEALQALIANLRSQATARDETLADVLARLDGETVRGADLEARLAIAEGQISEVEKARLAEVAAAEILRERLAGVEAALSEEEVARLADAAAAEMLRERLENADTELTAMTLALEEQRKRAEETLTLLAAAEAAKDASEQDAQDAKAQLSAAEERAALLAVAQKALSEQEAQTLDEQRKLALLNEQVAALRAQLGGLQLLLDDSAARDAQSDVQLQALGSQLNTALARVAAEEKRRRKLEEAERIRLEAETKDLARYKSEFFGQLRDLLGREEGVRIVGDRFVFSSEVLFQTGDAELSAEGRAQIARIAAILKRVSDDIPPEIDWVIRVDGHTDNQPLSGFGRYRDNWELSQGRALSVVRYMADGLGISPNRLAANGFGEYQPINPADTPAAWAQNRRIELKFTER
ncbi:MAG: peptidoglycan -binding protein [Marinosulfonomonas sp.]|nr:peptidoglycan -binding protein [Marinosulfonomonas sp.]